MFSAYRSYPQIVASLALFASSAYALDAVDVAKPYVGTATYASYGNGLWITRDTDPLLTSDIKFDCTGLTWYAFGHLGIEIPTTTGPQSNTGTEIPFERPLDLSILRRGDLLFFDAGDPDPSGKIDHVGIYEENGMFIQAQSPGAGITRRHLKDDWKYEARLRKVTRLPSIQGTPSPAFSIGQSVAMKEGGVSVRRLRQEDILDPDGKKHEAGDTGKIVFGPVKHKLSSTGMSYWWWLVDFDSGTDGWVAEQFLQRIDVPPGTPITDIDFADSNLRQCVLDAATASGWQTVEQVTALSCAGRNISSLAGLESFINLQTLDFGDNQITDTAPLVNLTQLGQLDLTGNNGIRCMELDGLTATLSSTTITRPADCVQQSGNFVWPVTNPIRTQGYATFNFHTAGYKPSPLGGIRL